MTSIETQYISGNITTNISDHLAQFLITSCQVHTETKPKKVLTKTFKSFVQDHFKHDLQNIAWEYTLDIHLHWVTKSILKPIKIKTTLYNKFSRAKDNKLKSDLCNKLQKYHNLILTLSRKRKGSYLKSFFEQNKKMVLKYGKE